jgi:regulatory protein
MRKRIIRNIDRIRERQTVRQERQRREEIARLKKNVLQDEVVSSGDSLYPRIVRFCLYRERCSSEILAQLYQYGVDEESAQKYLSYLREEKYYDDERFCREYAYGKVRSRGWGREKIRYELESMGLEEKYIRAALAAIDPDLFEKQMKKAARQKIASLPPALDRRRRVFRFLKSRGYTTQEIVSLLDFLPETRISAPNADEKTDDKTQNTPQNHA